MRTRVGHERCYAGRGKQLPVSRPIKVGRIWKRKAEPAGVGSIQLSMADLL